MKLVKGSILVLFIYLVTILPVEAKAIIPEVDEPRIAIVIDVIDGNALRVMYLKTSASIPEVDLILLSGVDTGGSDIAFSYTKQQLLGKSIFVMRDSGLALEPGFTKAYVFLQTNESFNETLLRFGYGELDGEEEDSMYYNDLVVANNVAKRQDIGIYKTSETPPNILNINTAPSSMLMEHFDIDYDIARQIMNYRINNPINNSLELGYVSSFFSRENILAFRGGIHYTTDVNTASNYELASLFNVSDNFDKAYELDKVRTFNEISSTDQLKEIKVIKPFFDNIELFIDVHQNENLLIEENKAKVNINTASQNELMEIGGLSNAVSEKIVDFREKYYHGFYSYEELAKPGFPMENLLVDTYKDELSLVTDLNLASEIEIQSLFSQFDMSSSYIEQLSKRIIYNRPFYSFDKVKTFLGVSIYENLEPFIVINGKASDSSIKININTVEKEAIINTFDLTDYERTRFLYGPSEYSLPSNIPFIDTDKGYALQLYTNINTASKEELLLLHNDVTLSFVNAIIKYRDYYPIYSYDDLYQICKDNNKLHLLYKIEDFIVYE